MSEGLATKRHLDAEVHRHGEKALGEKNVEVGAEQQCIAVLVRAALGVGFNLTGFECRPTPNTKA
jgi:hypothetical protein